MTDLIDMPTFSRRLFYPVYRPVLWAALGILILLFAMSNTSVAYGQPRHGVHQLRIPADDVGFDRYRSVGTIASADEMCAVLDLPIFRRPIAAYRLLDSVNSDLRWQDIEGAALWVRQKFEQSGINLQRLTLHPDSLLMAEQSLSACLLRKERERPELFEILKGHFLQQLKPNCFRPRLEVTKRVDDRGNLIEVQTPANKEPCIDFFYNGAQIGDWNATTFSLMLIWKEAHPVLTNIFQKGDSTLVSRMNEQQRREQAEKAASQERRRIALDRAEEAERRWQEYASRSKTLLEQVFNFASLGNVEGSRSARWVEVRKCVMSNGLREIDARRINMTAFRVTRQKLGDTLYLVSSDGDFSLSTLATIPIDRLQNAWSQAFAECPGTRSRF